ncbi:MAG TPA: hypothetical protein VMR52_00545 [Dehalococcoidia bacterium]|nr:hypothetical protein [Dehalococcoidia bacterium]
MGRAFMYASLVVLAVFVLTATFALEHGGKSIASVQDVSIHDISSIPPRFIDAHVTTTGTLSYSDEHELYQVTGEANTALVIRKYHGHRDLGTVVGREVRVNGVVGSEDFTGVYIDADSVEPTAND